MNNGELIEYKPAGLVLAPDLSYEQWYEAGMSLKGITQNIQWWWGDYLNYGERKYGEKYEQAVNDFGMNYETARQYARVANAYEMCSRLHNLSWSHHHEATAVEDPEERTALLEKAAEEGISKNDLRKLVRQKKIEKVREENPLPEGTYRVIYADPPWKYNDELIEGYGAATHHYETLSIKELCELQDTEGRTVKDISQDDAVLFMWTTTPLLVDAFSVIREWGFDYKAQFVWDKVQHNYGHYNSVRHELLLIATRGSCVPDGATLHDSVVEVPRNEIHSEKPDQFYEIIEDMYHEGPYIELFARRAREGWDRWGNEA